ncbi:MerR family transcriptional regulator [Maridesulfovibrio ferrireducens]|uniref:MerR family transcriptional regulator n=1 Tax=Maridesulfovibrio ferrireducens TaxID=246191 RepID=UPI001A32FFD9|nr:MerR family transcriptional regulator [Maridesulfovibrio ferrireducens]MBI9112326.1 MerR family transcriptional regulator [Maridesulfovibrio ferrireducens]
MSRQNESKIYKIGQAAKLVGLKSYVLRFWEGEFEQLEPIRTPSGQRLYNEEHVQLIARIKMLLHDEGLTIEGARKRLDSFDPQSDAEMTAELLEKFPAEQLPLFGMDNKSEGSFDTAILKEIHAELLVVRKLLD